MLLRATLVDIATLAVDAIVNAANSALRSRAIDLNRSGTKFYLSGLVCRRKAHQVPEDFFRSRGSQ